MGEHILETTTIIKLDYGCKILEAFQPTTHKLYAIEQTLNIRWILLLLCLALLCEERSE